MSELGEKVEQLVSDFLSLDVVKRYQKVKEEYLNSQVYLSLLELEKKKKEASRIKDYQERKEALSLIKEERDALLSSPLHINYEAYKKEIEDLIAPLRETEF